MYSFYVPYHLTVMEVALSIARVGIFKDHVITSTGAPTVDVIATAKVDLSVGDTIDGPGGYKSYGLCENVATARADNALPMGIAEGSRVIRAVKKDTVLTYDDVELPQNSLAVSLRRDQDNHSFEYVH